MLSVYQVLRYTRAPKWQNIGKTYPNLEIHTEVYILIDLCSAEAYFQDGRQSLGIYGPTCLNLIISDSISIKPSVINKLMTFLKKIEVEVKGQGHFMGLIRLKKASNVARDRISPNQNKIYLTPSGLI